MNCLLAAPNDVKGWHKEQKVFPLNNSDFFVQRSWDKNLAIATGMY
jgi:hypothetical protein